MNSDALISLCATWLAAWTGNHPENLIVFYSENAFYRDPAKPTGLRGHTELLPYLQQVGH